MLIVGCSHGMHLAQKIAKKLKIPYSNLKVEKFPDNEIGLKFASNVNGKIVVLVQSFYGNVNDCVMEVLFAAETAYDLGAKKVFLVALYLPYMRKDKRYEYGECISCKVIASILSKSVDKVFVIDPHINKGVKLSKLFSIKSIQLSSNQFIINYIKKNIQNPLIFGPDKGSLEMVKIISRKLKCKYVIMEKKRISGKKVKVRLNKKLDYNNKNIVFIDDIISTGNTILESVKVLKKSGIKKFNCVAVHGVLVENAIKKLRKANVKVVTTNTIPNKVAEIDVSHLISQALKSEQ